MKYIVTMTRRVAVTESSCATVEAESPQAALDAAHVLYIDGWPGEFERDCREVESVCGSVCDGDGNETLLEEEG